MSDDEEKLRWIIRDITERKRARRELQQSEEFNRRIIESSNDCIKILDLAGNLLYLNPKGQELLEMEDDSCIGSDWLDFWNDVDKATLKQEIEKAKGGGSGRFQGQNPTMRGTKKWWDVLISPVLDVEGEVERLLVISRDITDQKLAAERLLQKEKFFRSLIENTHDIISVLLFDGTIVYESPACEHILGYRIEERIGRICFDYVHPDDFAAVTEAFRKAIENKNLSQPVEYRYRHKNGAWIYLEVTGRVSSDEAGEPIVIVNKRDITDRKIVEAKLRASEERYRNVVETQTELICRFLPDSTLTFVNEAYCRFFGKSREELIGRKFYELIPEDARPRTEAFVQTLLRDRQSKTIEHEVIQADGSVGWQLWIDYLILDAQGNLIELQGIGRDTTEQNRIAKALVESEEKYRQIVDTMMEGIWIVNTDKRIYFVNRQLAEMLGYTVEELIGKPVFELYDEETKSGASEIRKRRKSGISEQYDARLYRKDGSYLWALISASPIFDETGKYAGALAMIADITERKQAEENLREQEELLRTLVQNLPNESVSVLDRDFRYLLAAGNELEKVGLSGEMLVGKRLQELYAKDSVDYTLPFYERAFAGEEVEFELPVFEQVYRLCAVPLYDQNRYIYAILIMAQNITEQKQKEERLQQLTARLLNLQDEERRRLARELHDETAQNLAALSINISALKKMLSPDDKQALDLLRESESLTSMSLREVRTLSYLLHPPTLDDIGLVSALNWFIRGFSARSGIKIEIVQHEEIGRLPSEIETALYRIVQEGLTNIHRHSGSQTASIELTKSPDKIVLLLKDEGQGILQEVSVNEGDDSLVLGVGIPGMRERLRLLGGNLEISSNEKGTT
ncbi:MAG TPA: PAS domain S-box protein, partial [Pyrinomonadaceae bacterium]